MMTNRKRAIVVADTSMLVNFLRIDRMDLIAEHSHDFLATDHVAVEITSQYPDQQRRFAEALRNGRVRQESITNLEEVALFASLSATGRLGAGECSAIALAVCRNYNLAIDDQRAATQARSLDPKLTILTTQDIIISMIGENLLNISEADAIKDDWAANHRFRLKIASFSDHL